MDALTRLRLRLPFVLAVRHKKQADLARALKISDSNISGLLHGRKGISLKMVDAIAAYLNVDFVNLFADQQAPVLDRQPAHAPGTRPTPSHADLEATLDALRTAWLKAAEVLVAFDDPAVKPPRDTPPRKKSRP